MKIIPEAWGIQRRYQRSDHLWRRVSGESVTALLEALGATGPRPLEDPDWPLVIRAGATPPLPGITSVRLEGGEERPISGSLAGDLPLGYHRLVGPGRERDLIVAPSRCHLPPDLRTFGFGVQLYASRSRHSWGIGDLDDLGTLGRWSRRVGAGMLLVSPLHAALPIPPIEPSPYYPSSRRFRNPLHLAVAPLAAEARVDVSDLAAEGVRLNTSRGIDRDRVMALKLAAMERIHATFNGDPDFDRYRAEEPRVDDFGLFCALAERHGRDSRLWPESIRRPDGPGLARAGHEFSDRAGFHAWIQWQLDGQLARAADTIPLFIDLAVGVDPGGFDAWSYQDLLAPDITVGAPPDTFNTQGQDWGLPAFHPWRLRDAGYRPFIDTLRANFRHAAGLRVDHVMALRRLWWVPGGLGPRGGAYVRYPFEDLLGIVALESVRAQAMVVGEDLGTVPGDLRQTLRHNGLLGYRLLIFEDGEPANLPRQVLAAITTHDLPTIAGLWSGADLARQQQLGLEPNAAETEVVLGRLCAGGLQRTAPLEAAILHAHRRLGQSRSMLLAATLEDVACVAERPNQPGTTAAQNPNWSVALPMTIEELTQRPTAAEIAAALRRETPERQGFGQSTAGI